MGILQFIRAYTKKCLRVKRKMVDSFRNFWRPTGEQRPEAEKQPLKCNGFTLKLTSTDPELREVIRCTRKKNPDGDQPEDIWGDCRKPWHSYTIEEEDCKDNWKTSADTGNVLISSMWRAIDKLARQLVPRTEIKKVICKVRFGSETETTFEVEVDDDNEEGGPPATKELRLRNFKLFIRKPTGLLSRLSPLQDITATQAYRLMRNSEGRTIQFGKDGEEYKAAEKLAEEAFESRNVDGTIEIIGEDGTKGEKNIKLDIYASYDHPDTSTLTKHAIVAGGVAGGVGLTALAANKYLSSKSKQGQ